MASLETINELLSYYQNNKHDAFKPKVKPKFVEVKTTDNTQIEYELQPTNNKFVSNNVEEYYQINVEFIGNSSDKTKYVPVKQYESGQYKLRYEESFKNALNNITDNNFMELEQLIHLSVFFAQSTKVASKARAYIKSVLALVENQLTDLKSNTGTAANEKNEPKQERTPSNKNHEKQNTTPVVEETAASSVQNQGSSLSVLKRVAQKADAINRLDTHTPKNFLIENEIIEVLKILKKDYKITEYELVNMALRNTFEQVFPELLEKLKPIEEMQYKILK